MTGCRAVNGNPPYMQGRSIVRGYHLCLASSENPVGVDPIKRAPALPVSLRFPVHSIGNTQPCCGNPTATCTELYSLLKWPKLGWTTLRCYLQKDEKGHRRIQHHIMVNVLGKMDTKNRKISNHLPRCPAVRAMLYTHTHTHPITPSACCY